MTQNTTTKSLTKGETRSLTKQFPMSTKLTVALGWDANNTDTGKAYDLDASAFLLREDGLLIDPTTGAGFVFYADPTYQGVTYNGDNRTGSGSGDDETIDVDLTAVPDNVKSIAFSTTIYAGRQRNQNFGQVKNAYIRLLDSTTGAELLRYDLSEDFSLETAVIFAELYRYGSEWKFRAIGNGYNDGLRGLCASYGFKILEEEDS